MNLEPSTGYFVEHVLPTLGLGQNWRIKHSIVDSQAPAYAAAVTSTCKHKQTIVKIALTGAITHTISKTVDTMEGDEVIVQYTTDGTQRIVTFAGDCVNTGTLTIAISKLAIVVFKFVGSNFVEVARANAMTIPS